MMLSPRLYGALRQRCGEVRIVNEGVAFSATLDPVKNTLRIKERGETYYTNCPLCHDAKGRLAVSHAWLTKVHGVLVTNAARCFNENCPVYRPAFYEDIQRRMVSKVGDDAVAQFATAAPVTRKPVVWRLPNGFVPLEQLPAGHPALSFISRKYVGFDPFYLSRFYSVGFTELYDDEYRLARNRVIFPVYFEGQLRGWQGRTIIHEESVRWYLPPGFNKAMARYNWDRVMPHQIPVITEGIPTAIAAGPTGIPIYGKELSEALCEDVGRRWKTAVIATDAETQVPDPRGNGAPKVYAQILKQRLDKYLQIPAVLFQYPPAVMDLARRKVNREKVSVPDLADFGLLGTSQLMQLLPHPWRSLTII